MIYDLQKASMWKRISAFLFDFILLTIVAVLFGWLLSTALGYDAQLSKLNAAYDRYGAEYGVDFHLSLSEYDALTESQREQLNAAYAALNADSDATSAYSMVVNLMLVITSIGILLGYVVLEYTIPMKRGNGQTLGKKIFGIGLMQQDGVRINGKILFVRTILGKYTLETMVPLFIVLMIWFGILGLVGTLVLVGIALVQGLMLLLTSKRLAIHDALSSTVLVDIASQMIFADHAAMIAYKEKLHAEKAARADY